MAVRLWEALAFPKRVKESSPILHAHSGPLNSGVSICLLMPEGEQRLWNSGVLSDDVYYMFMEIFTRFTVFMIFMIFSIHGS